MSIYYPSFMPSPQVDYSYSNQTGTLKMTMESGRIVQRARQTSQRDIAKAQFKFTYPQLLVWESFVANSINNGAAEFYIKVPNPGNQDISDRLALLDGGLYEAVAIAGQAVWAVSCVLILQEKQTISLAGIALLELFAGDADDAVDWSNWLHEIVHEILPENLS